MDKQNFFVWDLENHQTKDVKDSHTNGELTVIWRDWDKIIKNPAMIYVDDHCNAIEMLLSDGKPGESYNISANNEIDNITIVNKILRIMDKSEDLIEFVEDRPGHDFRYSMDSRKISKEIGWEIKSSFDKGLEKTIQWYLDNPDILNEISSTVLDSTPWKSSNKL